MTPDQLFEQFDALLEEERQAIRRLDGESVHRISAEKTDLFLEIRNVVRENNELASQFRGLAAGLRRNAVLLAHARDCLRDVLAAVVESGPATPFAASGANARLSVRG